jgi:hypothetical protein
VQQIGGAQVGDGISLAMLVNQQRKSDARFFAENPCIVAIAQADGGESGAFVPEGRFVFAQLRDVLAAKNSAIVAKKNDDGRLILPQRAQTDFLAIAIGENNICEPLAKSFLHVDSSLTRRHSSVKGRVVSLVSRRLAAATKLTSRLPKRTSEADISPAVR